jgi:ATP-binding cassette subfamily C protein
MLIYVAVRVLQVPLAELMVLVFVFSRTAPRVRDLHLCYQQILNAVPALRSAVELQRECDAASEHISPLPSGDRSLKDAIAVQSVSYRYVSRSGCWALRNASLTIPANTTTAITGRSGSGKSTLADLLLGLIMPVEGVITIDGRPLEAQWLHEWRQQIGYVPQTTFLLHGTVRENLLWARPTASDNELRDALRMAAADEFVDRLPKGLDTRVGGRGGRLSGGEAQRIALARALLRQPSMLILDEAMSSLDIDNQHRIQRAIQQLHGRLTIIVIAHRLSAIRDADQIVVLEEGHVAECGGYDDLAERTGGRLRAILAADDATAARGPWTPRVNAS